MTTFGVMTWNVENLYLPGSGYGPASDALYREKLDRIAGVLMDLDPDVAALQEIGDDDAFADLLGPLSGRYPYAHLSARPDARGIRVGFLSKHEMHDPLDFVDFPEEGLVAVPGFDGSGDPVTVTRMGRGALQVRVHPKPDFPVHLITAHLKSKLLSYPGRSGRPRFSPENENERSRTAAVALLKRAAEAAALRVRANAVLEAADAALVVLGDLNDVVDAATTQILKGPGGSEIRSPVAFDRPDQGDAARLWNLAHLIPENRRFSRRYKGNGELIDHIFASSRLLAGRSANLPQVDSHVDIADGGLPSVNDHPGERANDLVSDHAPVTARFRV